MENIIREQDLALQQQFSYKSSKLSDNSNSHCKLTVECQESQTLQ